MEKKEKDVTYDFKWSGNLTKEMKASFDENGFILAREFLDGEEVEQLRKVVSHPDGILKHSYMTYEENGRCIQRTLCKHPGNDVTGMVARSERLVNCCSELLECEVYHWCSMYIIKKAKVGGEHVWHQDYGYWYNDGVLYPDMITVWIALDPCHRTNSCKQALIGSHKCGRVNHGKVASGQTGADEARVKLVEAECTHAYLEMQPGDAFIHHGNLLHRSGANISSEDRWGFMSCYNGRHNSPRTDTEYPKYTPIQQVPDIEIKKCQNYTNFDGKEFILRKVNNMKRKISS